MWSPIVAGEQGDRVTSAQDPVLKVAAEGLDFVDGNRVPLGWGGGHLSGAVVYLLVFSSFRASYEGEQERNAPRQK